jgi:Ulp1 family protease
MPILTSVDESKQIDHLVNYNDSIMKHWMISIISTETQTIEIYDSLNRNNSFIFWSDLLVSWTKYTLNMECKSFRFNSDICHQHMSLNCGYFCSLYLQFHISGKTMNEIEKSDSCTELFIDTKYKPIIDTKFK